MTDTNTLPLQQEWLVIVNPNAGRKKGEKDWPVISGLLKEAEFNFLPLSTQHRDHAIHMAQEYINKGFRNIIVVGGDGTLNEVVNGIFRQNACPTTDIKLGMIMVGTGNDWGRMYNIKAKYRKAIKILKKGRLFVQDTGFVTYHHGTELKQRYFMNMAGMGYDALVAQMTNRLKEKGGGGPMAYLYNLFKGLFKYRHTLMDVIIDDQVVYRGNVFSMSIGICRYNGGGMMQLPNAIPDDGILDMTIMKNVKKMDVVKNIKKLYDGSFLDLHFIEVHTGRKITIQAMPQHSAFLETDGESLGNSPFVFEIIPKSLTVFTGKDWQGKNEERKNTPKT
jgi:YegS/Rv2252/BmrU family lipid kinase